MWSVCVFVQILHCHFIWVCGDGGFQNEGNVEKVCALLELLSPICAKSYSRHDSHFREGVKNIQRGALKFAAKGHKTPTPP